MTTPLTTLETLRAQVRDLWAAEQNPEVRCLLWTAWAALNTVCRLARKDVDHE